MKKLPTAFQVLDRIAGMQEYQISRILKGQRGYPEENKAYDDLQRIKNSQDRQSSIEIWAKASEDLEFWLSAHPKFRWWSKSKRVRAAYRRLADRVHLAWELPADFDHPPRNGRMWRRRRCSRGLPPLRGNWFDFRLQTSDLDGLIGYRSISAQSGQAPSVSSELFVLPVSWRSFGPEVSEDRVLCLLPGALQQVEIKLADEAREDRRRTHAERLRIKRMAMRIAHKLVARKTVN